MFIYSSLCINVFLYNLPLFICKVQLIFFLKLFYITMKRAFGNSLVFNKIHVCVISKSDRLKLFINLSYL